MNDPNPNRQFLRWLNIVAITGFMLLFDLKTFECFSLVAKTPEWQTNSFMYCQQSIVQLCMQASGGHLPLLLLLLANFLIGAGIFIDKVGSSIVIAAQVAILLFDVWIIEKFGMIDLCFVLGSIAEKEEFLVFLLMNYLAGFLVGYNFFKKKRAKA